MFKRPSAQRNEEQKLLRGTIMRLLSIAVAEEITVDDPYTIDGAVLVKVLKEHATLGSSSANEIRTALRYLHEKNYVNVNWLATGDFTRVRVTTSGIDLVEGTLGDHGINLGRH
jgi:hypothetical protein